MPRKRTFFFKLIGLFFLFGSLLSGLMALANIAWTRKGLMAERQKAAETLAADILASPAFSEGIRQGDLGLLSKALGPASSSPQVLYVGLYGDDRILINSGLDILDQGAMNQPLLHPPADVRAERTATSAHRFLDYTVPYRIRPQAVPKVSSEDMLFGAVEPAAVTTAREHRGVLRLGIALDDVYQTLRTLTRQNLVIMAAAVSLGLGAAVFLGMAVSGPVKRLHAGITQVAQGNFDHRVILKSRDELGQLAQAFNHMGEELQILDRLSQDFSQLVDFAHWQKTLLECAETIFPPADGLALLVLRGGGVRCAAQGGTWEGPMREALEGGGADLLDGYLQQEREAPGSAPRGSLAARSPFEAVEPVGHKGKERFFLLVSNAPFHRPLSPRHLRMLRALGRESAQALERIGLHEAVIAEAAKEREMNIAAKIQTAMLMDMPMAPGFEVSAGMIPAEEVGGDYYDVLPCDEKRFWVGIGDVSGHGVNAGLIMLMTQSLIVGMVAADPETSPDRVIFNVNRILFENVQRRMQEDQYMTLLLLKHLGNGDFAYSGNHLNILLFRKKIGQCEAIPTEGVWMGILPDVHPDTLHHVSMEPGDVMVLYTDGLVEARNAEGELFELERLRVLIREKAPLPPVVLRDAVFDRVRTWSPLPKDDMTLCVLKRWQ